MTAAWIALFVLPVAIVLAAVFVYWISGKPLERS